MNDEIQYRPLGVGDRLEAGDEWDFGSDKWETIPPKYIERGSTVTEDASFKYRRPYSPTKESPSSTPHEPTDSEMLTGIEEQFKAVCWNPYKSKWEVTGLSAYGEGPTVRDALKSAMQQTRKQEHE